MNTFQLTQVKLGAQIGIGAQGRIVAASDREEKEVFALKIILKGQDISQEATILPMIQHQSIVRYMGYFEDDSHIYYKMELVKGIPLYQYLGVKPLTLNHSLFYLVQIIEAIDYLHQKNIIYRDLKPENLIINDRGYLKLLDFGLSKLTSKRTFTICGTPEYMAPEIINQKDGHSKAIDVWAIGIFLYEMLTGETPFKNKDPYKIYSSILHSEPKFPKVIEKNVRRFICSLLIKDQDERMEALMGGVKNLLSDRIFARSQSKLITEQSLEAPFIPDTIPLDIYLRHDPNLIRLLENQRQVKFEAF